VSESCLVTKLSRYADLSERDEGLLRAFEETEREFRKDQIVRRHGVPVDEMFVVKSGWLTSFSILADGRRQLLKLYYPGDIIDLSDVASDRATADVKAITPSVLCPFLKKGLGPVFETSPRLTSLLFATAVRENALLTDRIRAVGRFSAYERVCYLLLEIAARLEEIDDIADGFRLPLTQSDIADLLGLTNVYVSKTMSRIEKDDLVRRQGNRIVILDAERMAAICEFRHSLPFDTTWYPAL
jgi:CRP/FNR family transcriptional regulator, anaerobic regulatory protein